jgi:hypothetical protein
MRNLFIRLKAKWGIESNFQFIMINVCFSLAGFSILFIRPLIFRIFGITPEMPLALRILLYILLISPTYFLTLNFFALLLGQSRFFLGFTKKTFSAFNRKKNKSEISKKQAV